jgi:hypothetical protein
VVAALEANEPFQSRCRCCPACCQGQIQIKNRQGQTQEVTEYYHRFVPEIHRAAAGQESIGDSANQLENPALARSAPGWEAAWRAATANQRRRFDSIIP